MPTIFLDDGGVMNDNRLRAPQWRRLVGEFFAPRLGGTPDAWSEANRVLTDTLFETTAFEARLAVAASYVDFDHTYQLDWIGGMCQIVGVRLPENAKCLADEATAWVVPQIQAAIPGVVEAVRELHAAGYELHTASGEPSTDLDAYLSGMGVRACFGRLYGPDLVDVMKFSPEYYRRVFDDAGVNPADALVVDDTPRALAWTKELGARTVLVGSASQQTVADATIPALRDLPRLLRTARAPGGVISPMG